MEFDMEKLENLKRGLNAAFLSGKQAENEREDEDDNDDVDEDVDKNEEGSKELIVLPETTPQSEDAERDTTILSNQFTNSEIRLVNFGNELLEAFPCDPDFDLDHSVLMEMRMIMMMNACSLMGSGFVISSEKIRVEDIEFQLHQDFVSTV